MRLGVRRNTTAGAALRLWRATRRCSTSSFWQKLVAALGALLSYCLAAQPSSSEQSRLAFGRFDLLTLV